jgi:elongator complex protein 6
VDGLTGLFLPKISAVRSEENTLYSPEFAAVSREIQRAIQSLKDNDEGNIVLVIDQLDLLLAVGGDQIGSVNLGEMLMGLREVSDIPRADVT